MDNKKLALFLGMICGDGCLTLRTRKAGYKTYAVEFFNTNVALVRTFFNLFGELFDSKGTITSYVKDASRKELFVFRKYSKELYNQVSNLGIPKGKKKLVLRIPPLINDLSWEEKFEFFRGVLITDGSLRKNNTILFHSGSKLFLEDLSKLIKDLFKINKKIVEYVQKGKYFSYQLHLNRDETKLAIGPRRIMVLHPA